MHVLLLLHLEPVCLKCNVKWLNNILLSAEGSNIDGVHTVPDIVHSVLFLSHFIPVVVLYDRCYYTHFIDEKIET